MFSNIFKTLLLSVLAIGLVEANLANQCTNLSLDSSQYIALRAQCTDGNGNTVSAFKWLDQCLWDHNGVLESGASPNGKVLARKCNEWFLVGTRLHYNCKKDDDTTIISSSIDMNTVIALGTDGQFTC